MTNNSLNLIQNEDEIYNIITNSKHNTLVLWGVLEHLRNPHNIFKAFVKSNCEYLCIGVPLFSIVVFFEFCFNKEVSERQLTSEHTHLFSKKSIEYLLNKYNLEIVGEWWFGSDIYDLYRSIYLRLKQEKCSDKTIKYLTKFLDVDKLQKSLDEKELCSEVHMVIKKIYD